MKSVFLSHASEDKVFARKIGFALKKIGIKVWIDEAEIQIGDTLKIKIESSIDSVDFLIVILSPNSVKSAWVKNEVKQALNKETIFKKVLVLPVLYQNCKIPNSIKEKLYADLTNELDFEREFDKILNRIKKDDKPESENEKYVRLKLKHPLLKKCDEEFDDIMVSSLPNSDIPCNDLEDFFLIYVKNNKGYKIFQTANLCFKAIQEKNCCYNVLEFIFEIRLVEDYLHLLRYNFLELKSDEAVIWGHKIFTEYIKADSFYQTFISINHEVLMKVCKNNVLEYLLFPDRGPESYNIDTFFFFFEKYKLNNEPFVHRIIEWIKTGKFDGRNNSSMSESAELFYKIISREDYIDENSINKIVNMVHFHVKEKLNEDLHLGIYHLQSMISARYKYTDIVLNEIINKSMVFENLYLEDEKVKEILRYLNLAINILAINKKDGETTERNEKLMEIQKELFTLDNISGFWNKN